MLIGAHVSPAGGPANAVQRGVERGCRAIQIFNQSPRQWKPTVYDKEKVAAVKAACGRAAKVIKEALAESDGCDLHLENTAGAGGTLGRTFEELAALIAGAGGRKRLRACLDSCHLLASGYDIRTAEGLSAVLDEFDRVVGMDRLGSLPVNDSKTPVGSNLDRHAP